MGYIQNETGKVRAGLSPRPHLSQDVPQWLTLNGWKVSEIEILVLIARHSYLAYFKSPPGKKHGISERSGNKGYMRIELHPAKLCRAKSCVKCP